MPDTPTQSLRAPVPLYVVWAIAALLMAMANRYVGLAVVIIGAIHIVAYPSLTRASLARQAEAARLAAEKAAAEAAEIEHLQHGALDAIKPSTPICAVLADGEACYWEEAAAEWRMHTYVELGSARGALTTTHIVPERVGVGSLAITDRRVIFKSDTHTRDVQLNAIKSIGDFADGVQIGLGRDRYLLFVSGNGRASIVLRRMLDDARSSGLELGVEDLPSHCASCGAPLKLVHRVCEYCGARVSHPH